MFTPIHLALGIEPGDLSLSLIEQAVEHGVRETGALDWKTNVYDPRKPQWDDEAAKDIAGFIAENGVFEGHGLSRLTTGGPSDAVLAEMYAIYFALSRFRQHRGKLVIRTDSRKAIALARTAMDGHCHHAKPAVQHVQTLLRTLQPRLEAKAIEFQWVKGHSGDLLNEVADTVAVLSRRHMQAGIPLSESRSRLEVFVRQALAAQSVEAAWGVAPKASSVALAA